MWIRESVPLLIEYKNLLQYWGKIYDPRSPIDKVDERFIECIHNRDYNNYYLEQLLYGSENEKRACYETDRDYPLAIKIRLDSLDTVSRKACKSKTL